jgi:hypothetical protein
MNDSEKLTVRQSASNFWTVRSGNADLSGAVTRQGAEAERELVRRLRRRAAQMRSAAPKRPPVVAHRSR